MTAYDRGAYLERKAAVEFTRGGWFVVRSAGSRGTVDLAALHPVLRPALIQCKVKADELDHDGWNRLFHLSSSLGVTPVLAAWRKRGRIGYVELLAPHERRSSVWPGRDFAVDELPLEVGKPIYLTGDANDDTAWI